MLLALALACSSAPDASPLVEVVFVRHAEKDTSVASDPPLTSAGEARARALAERLADAHVVSVHSTDTLRTRSTAAPTARHHKLALQIYDGHHPEEMLEALKGEPGVHLVVGHSNTVPALVESIGGTGGKPIDETSEYDRIYSVVLNGADQPVTVLSRYGSQRFERGTP